jgi:probable F420-dependent oxidoreductase
MEKHMAHIGVSIFPTDYAIQPVELARAVEDRGLDSLFVCEHTHIPVSRRSPWPGGDELPKEYWHTHDPFVALAAAAAVTERIKLGTGVCLVVERDPIQLAKEVASLDMISGGRVILGIGGGWNGEEMGNHGVAFETRWRVIKEKVEAMRTIWSEDTPEYHGEFVDFDPIWSYPKPLQVGGPPLWLGAQSKWAFPRVVDYCDGWMPISVRKPGLDGGLTKLRAECEKVGENYDRFDKAVFIAPAEESASRELIESGFTHLIYALPAESSDKVLPILDKYAALANRLR